MERITFERDDYSGEQAVLLVTARTDSSIDFVINPVTKDGRGGERFRLELVADDVASLDMFDTYDEGGMVVASGMVDDSEADALDLITELHRTYPTTGGDRLLAAALASAQVICNTK